ncbi:MAG: GDYXXLXY domain-containing protein [Candidatus Paceibacterota bacterium]
MKTNYPKSVKFASAIIVQLAIVIGLVVFNASLLARGTEIVLPIKPVDPRDPLRGDYITMQYDISRIDASAVEGKNKEIEKNDIVYVALKKQGNAWAAASVALKKPRVGLFIKGNVSYVGYSDWKTKKQSISIIYGIEEYFIPEGTGTDLAQKMRTKNAFARVVVDAGGTAILKDIFFTDK